MDNSLVIVIAMGTGRSTFESCQGQDIFLFYKTCRLSLGYSQSHI